MREWIMIIHGHCKLLMKWHGHTGFKSAEGTWGERRACENPLIIMGGGTSP